MTVISETHLYREIHEQPVSLARLLDRGRGPVAELAHAVEQRNISHVVIAARGTSDNAARYAKYVLGAFNGLTVGLATPSLHTIFEHPPRFQNALVLGISQSGKSPDIVAVLAEARRQGALTGVLTNNSGSALAQQGDVVVNLEAGVENAVAATKTYTASLAAIALLSATLSRDSAQQAQLVAIPEAVEATLAMQAPVAAVAPRYRYMQRCVAIGRGFNYATAFELALKLKELTYTPVEPYSSADFLHGPMAVLDPGFPVILIAPKGHMSREIREFAKGLREWEPETVAFSDDDDLLREVRIPLKLPHPVAEWLSPITAIVPGQLLALHLAHTRDLDVDAPRGLRKVTETR